MRLYDGTVPADCYRAIAEVVARLALAEGTASHAPESGELLALLNRLAAPQVSVEARMDLVEQVRRMVIKA